MKDGTNDSILGNAAFEAMKLCLELTPFTFILDEADQLNFKGPNQRPFYGFEHLRRALSYLADGTNVFFLSLGTRSTVHDLNPEPRDDSKRYTKRTKLLKPIVLLSNSSIFAKDTYPTEKLKLSPDVLKNSLFFKYLVILGHPLWSSIPFNKIVHLATEKLKNGFGKNDYSYVLVLWLIRAGLMANPLDMNTRSLVASQMATLFNLSEDLARMIVFYPSEPVLAMACRRILSEINLPSADEHIFTELEELIEAVQVDRGALSEVVGTMCVLTAIDSSTTCAESPSVAKLTEEMEDFKTLWEKERFVLEPDAEDEEEKAQATGAEAEPRNINIGFEDYHVTSVEHFLGKLLPPGKFEEIKAKLPSSTLAGLVNASHAVKLFRTRDGLEFDGTTFETMNLPRADDRIPDKNCNLIDDALLKLGLAHQCCFLMPDRYYGFDLIVPVLLADGSFTFIGIQFKAAGASIGGSLKEMQARFHYVKCPSTAEPHSCANCSQNVSEIFANQICLLISLDPRDSKDFATKTKSSLPSSAHDQLKQKLRTDGSELEVVLSSDVKTENFWKPLLSVRERIEYNEQDAAVDSSLALFSSIWFDDFVELPGNKLKLSAKKDDAIDFIPDPFLHRQYCIGIRGMESFRHLFHPANSIKNAQRLLSAETDFFGRLRREKDPWISLSYLKSVFYDARLNYPDANYTLAAWRGLADETRPFGFKALDELEPSFLKSQVAGSLKLPSYDAALSIAERMLDSECPSKKPSEHKALICLPKERRFFTPPDAMDVD